MTHVEDPDTFEALRRARIDAEPLRHLSSDAVVLGAYGSAVAWLGDDAIGRPFATLFEESEEAQACVDAEMMAIDELGLTLADGRRVLAVNLDGLFITLREGAKHMVERGGGGALVAVSSVSAIHGAPRSVSMAGWTASKTSRRCGSSPRPSPSGSDCKRWRASRRPWLVS